MAKTIIANASPLIAFGRINRITLISKTLGKIVIPEVIAQECLLDRSRPGAIEIEKAINKNLINLFPQKQITQLPKLAETLDEGEAAAISLAVQLKTGILIDEKLGRKAAKNLNINVIGTAGVLLLAKQKNIIPKVKPVISALKDCGYYISEELFKEILKRSREK